MGVDNSDDGIDPYAAGLIRFKTRQLVGQAGFTASDREDIEQELILDSAAPAAEVQPQARPAQHVHRPGGRAQSSLPSSKRKRPVSGTTGAAAVP